MIPIQHFSSSVLAEVVRRQPPSNDRTAFAWQIAVGQAIARMTAVQIVDGVLHVSSRDARWGHEVSRAAATILSRMQLLLGAETVTGLEVVSDR